MMDTSTEQVIPGPASSSQFLDIPSLVRIVLLRRRLIAGASVACAILLFAASLLLKNTYKATALVMPPDHSSSSLSMLSSAGLPAGALAALNVKSPGDLYVALMQSPAVENSVIDRFNLQTLYKRKHRSEARRELESRMQILSDAKSGIISVSVVDTDPDRAAAMANAIVDGFDKLSSQLAITDAARRRLFFERQVAETRANLGRAEDALQASSARTGILEPEGNARATIGYEEQLRAQIAAKSVELQSLQTYNSDENPEVQTARRELQALQGQAGALKQSTTGGAGGTKASQSSASLDYARKLREVRYNETVFELLMKNLEVARLDEAREGNVVQIISSATPPDMKDGPHRSFFLVGGFLLGLLGSVIWVLLRWSLGFRPAR